MVDAPIFEFLPPAKKIDLSDQKSPGIPTTSPASPYLGKYIAIYPVGSPGKESKVNQYANLNFTGPPGTASAMYFSTISKIAKMDFHVAEVDEWIEVSPFHTAYYQQTMAQKQALETTIKSGLASAAQAVADYELVKHDMRKYKEFMDYFEQIEKAKQIKDPKKRAKKLEEAEHILKSIFIDQVDVHNGPMSMIQMATRWPTLIPDFMRLSEKDRNVEEIMKKLGISRAEAVVLKTKNELYLEWKKMFSQIVKERYELLRGMVEARKKYIEEYRKWLKPYIARYQMIKTGASIESIRSQILESFADITGQATFSNFIRIWAWKPVTIAEEREYPVEITDKFLINPYDDFIREKFILNKKNGLASIYPWLLEKRNGKTRADELVNEILSQWKNGENGLDPKRLYYIFLDFYITRSGLRLPVGEVEDITFLIKAGILSQNILLVKLLELKCRQIELDRYIEEILGISKEEKPIVEIVKREYPALFGEHKPEKEKTGIEKFGEELKNFFKELSSSISAIFPSPGKYKPYFFKPGPYESNFKDRIAKVYLPHSGGALGSISGFIKSQMGV